MIYDQRMKYQIKFAVVRHLSQLRCKVMHVVYMEHGYIVYQSLV